VRWAWPCNHCNRHRSLGRRQWSEPPEGTHQGKEPSV